MTTDVSAALIFLFMTVTYTIRTVRHTSISLGKVTTTRPEECTHAALSTKVYTKGAHIEAAAAASNTINRETALLLVEGATILN